MLLARLEVTMCVSNFEMCDYELCNCLIKRWLSNKLYKKNRAMATNFF